MTRLLISFTLIATLLLGCADQSSSVRPDDDGGGSAVVTEGPTQEPGGQTADIDESGEPALDVDAEGRESGDGDTALPDPLTGTLGREDIEGGCVYLESAGQRFELVAGPGATIVVDPDNGVIADTDGEVIAEPGDTITVDGSLDPGMASFCQIGQIVVVDSITAE
ncbi:MAG TPA: hypothetical protein VMM13_04290 [Euzebya sp.]|nr:hypothetical protein [Euzebya sp.]